MASFSLVADVAAPPTVVFDVLTDHRGYAAITPLRSAELEREGDPAPNGVGAVRVFRAIGPPLREEVRAYDPPSRFAYSIISGAPVREHLGTVELSESHSGTRVDYRVEVTPSLPLAGPLVVGIMRLSVRRLLRGVAREAERRAVTR